jgi:putative flippase GtrA
VSGIRDLYGRFRHLIHEGAKFLVVGGIGTVVTFVVANALHSIGEYKAITVATIVATVITYVGNRYWSFRHRQGNGTARESVVFFILNAIGLLIYYACIWLVVDAAGLKGKLWYNVALVVGTGLGTLFRFWSYRKWVWGTPKHPEQPVHPGSAGPNGLDPTEDHAIMGTGPEQEQLSPVTAAAQARDPQAPRPAGAHRRR